MPYVANSGPTLYEGATFNGRYVAVYDYTISRMLYAKNAFSPFMWVASTTKIMTALLAQEIKGSVLDSQTVTWLAQDDLAAGYSQVGFTENDVITWRDLLQGLWKVSGGDACTAVARIIGNEDFWNTGSLASDLTGVERFKRMMNLRALELGLNSVRYGDSHGAAQNLLSARDMAVLAGAVNANAKTAEFFSSTTYNINVTGVNARTIGLTNSNPMLSDPDVKMVKTGSLIMTAPEVTTYSLVTVWEAPNGNKIAIVTLDCSTSTGRYDDTNFVIGDIVARFPYLA